MYTVPRFIPKVYLIHCDGCRWEFKDIKEAAATLWRWRFLGHYCEVPLFASHFTEARYHDYYDIQYDD